MTTQTTTTRRWGSSNSVESITNRYRDPGAGQICINWNSEIEQTTGSHDQQCRRSTRNSFTRISRMTFLATPKCKLRKEAQNLDETNGVKRSALLYEITERTNRLAQPKTNASNGDRCEVEASRASLPATRTHSRISERFSELSRPKTIYVPSVKPPGYIAPSALRAVATQRILELATPRKTRTPRPPRRHAVVYAPCSSRISYLARPKHSVVGKQVQKNFLKRSMPTEIQPPPWEVPGTRLWQELGYSANLIRRCQDERKKNKNRSKRVRKFRRERMPPEPSKSDASVLSLTVRKNSTKSLRRRRKKVRLNRNRRKNREILRISRNR